MVDAATREQTEAGRTASAEELSNRLAEAPGPYLSGALANAALTHEHVMLILRNPGAPAAVLHGIGSEPRWVRSYETKRGIVRHSHAPHAMALNLVAFLFWRDLALVADDPYAFPPLRRRAETLLVERLSEMALGEKISLARIAGRALLPPLLADGHARVVEAALWNGRLTTGDLLRAIRSTATTPEALAAIGNHPRWKGRGDVAMALARNARTPLATTLGFLTSLPESALSVLLRDPDTPRALRMAAQKVADQRSARRGGRGPGAA
jgi:hypothetical protein